LILDDLAHAAACTGGLVGRIADDQWSASTPCPDWNVRDVVRHLVGMNLVLVAMFEQSPMPDRDADRLGADPAGAFRGSVATLQAVAARPGALERSQTTRVGTATGAERIRWRIVDLLVHAWDLAQAVGVPAEFADDLVERAFAFAAGSLPGQPRAGRFDDPQPVRDDAPALDRLAALTGRAVPWTGRQRTRT
jgi:uncharacterized protein (TIGR03086 family)